MEQTNFRALLASSITVGLVACGGGGGGDGGNNDTLLNDPNLLQDSVDTNDTETDSQDETMTDTFVAANGQTIKPGFHDVDYVRPGVIIGGQPGTGNRVPLSSTPEQEFWGVADIIGTEQPFFDGIFGVFDSRKAVQRYLSRVNRELDACHVLLDDEEDEEDFHAEIDHWEMNVRDAGEVVILSTPEGTVAEVEFDDFFGYESSRLDIRDLPSDLTLDITGGTFPAMPTMTFPVVEQFTGVKRQVNVSGSSRFTNYIPEAGAPIYWDAGSDPDATIEIEYKGNVRVGSGFELTNVYCTLADDGEFEFPEAVTSRMKVEGATGILQAVRQKVDVVVANGATVLLVNRD